MDLVGTLSARQKEVMWSVLRRFLGDSKIRLIKQLRARVRKLPFDAAIYVGPNDHVCNLSCEYCPFPHEKGRPEPFDVEPLLRTLDKTGKTFLINICGNGDPFLTPNIVEVCSRLTERHYIALTSNLLPERVVEFSQRISPRRVMYFLGSLHIKELERRRATDKFIERFHLLRNAGFSVGSEAVAHPPLAPEAEKYRKYFLTRGIQLGYVPCNATIDGKRYPYDYTVEERTAFGLPSMDETKQSRFRRGTKCNAGYNVAFLHENGTFFPCFGIADVALGNLRDEVLTFKNAITYCPVEECFCPLDRLEPPLYHAMLREQRHADAQ
jgi:MoaA/NifB/PqqE/SkfB family radical SAM enzyme